MTSGYFNYTSKSGIGASVAGRLGTVNTGAEAGIHFLKGGPQFMAFALVSVDLSSYFAATWISLLRYTPPINENWKVYTSLELYSNIGDIQGDIRHRASVQRIRGGVERSGYAFGLGLNLTGIGPDYDPTLTNPGIFVRKSFQ